MSIAAAFSRSRWAALALVASLVLNGFLLGMLVTGSLHRDHRRDGPRIGGFELRRLSERLPADAVDLVAAELQARRPAVDARIERLRAIREEVNALAAQPAPDRAAIDQRLAALRAEVSAMQEEVQRATYDALLKLPPEVRAGLARKPDRG
jgi:uncharacterized membrane protein